jgi:thiamine-monophosphate kinase
VHVQLNDKMKLSNIGEFGLIRAIQKLAARRSPGTMIGIGDDAAVLKVAPATVLLATTDMLIEGVHFDLTYTDFYSLGWKSAAVNLSDIAAMGGKPRYCLTSLAIPSHISVEAVKDYYQGFTALIGAHNTVLVGGDTCSSKDGLVISVTVLGEAGKRTVVPRSGAKQGDRIFVTGVLGDSGAGLELLKSGNAGKRRKSNNRAPRSDIEKLIGKHLRPLPRVEWGRQVAHSGCASSMIDVSDGLSSDLSHLCEESCVGAVLFSEVLPVSRSFLKSADRLHRSPLYYVLSGGEDYELLFTVPSARMKKLEALSLPVTEIGMITTGNEMFLMDAAGRKTVLKPTGYTHFKRTGNCAKRSR